MVGAAGGQYLFGARPRQLVYEFLHLLRASNGLLESQNRVAAATPPLKPPDALSRQSRLASDRHWGVRMTSATQP